MKNIKIIVEKHSDGYIAYPLGIEGVVNWEITTDPETMPENSTSFIVTNLQGNLKKALGDLFGLRTWAKRAFARRIWFSLLVNKIIVEQIIV